MATCVLSLTGNNKLDIIISSGAKKVARLLVGHNFKTARNDLPKLHNFSEHVCNSIVKFQRRWDADVEMTVAEKL